MRKNSKRYSQRKHLILNVIREHEPITRARIAEITDLNIPTISEILNDLIEKKIVEIASYDISTGGRKPMLVRLNPAYGYIIGVGVESTYIRGILTDMSCNVVAVEHIPAARELSQKSILDDLRACIGRLVEAVPGEKEKISGIGIGMTGLIDRARGVSLAFPQLESWREVPVARIVSEEFGIQTFLGNNVAVSTMGVQQYGYGHNIDNFIYVHLGPGVGMGMVINGEFYQGDARLAGELGHITIQPDGPLCYCGNYGCLETVSSESAVKKKIKEALEQGVKSRLNDFSDDIDGMPMEEFFKAAGEGDRLAHNILEQTGEHLGIGMANVINLLNPRLIVLGGTFADAGELLINSIKRTLQSRSLEQSEKHCELKISKLGLDAGAKGAVALVLKHLLSPENAGKNSFIDNI